MDHTRSKATGVCQPGIHTQGLENSHVRSNNTFIVSRYAPSVNYRLWLRNHTSMSSSLIDTVVLLSVRYALNNDTVGFRNILHPETVIEIQYS